MIMKNYIRLGANIISGESAMIAKRVIFQAVGGKSFTRVAHSRNFSDGLALLTRMGRYTTIETMSTQAETSLS